jgi:dTDP-4-dehydrorhamnose 3,5-epimerase
VNCIATPLPGLHLIELEVRADARGFFARTYCQQEFANFGLDFRLCQINLSYATKAGTVRGMHFQRPPKAEAKVVQCVSGEVFDIAVDLRPNSPTYCKWYGVRLTGRERQMFYIPEGFAHGFQTLTDDAEVQYLMGEFYAPECQAGVRWNDPAFGIEWPLPITVIAERDLSYAEFQP